MVTVLHSKECRINQQRGVCMFIGHIILTIAIHILMIQFSWFVE